MTGDIIRLNLTSKGESKLSYLRPSVCPYYHVVTIGEGANRQVRTEQVTPESMRNSVSQSATSRVTQGSTGDGACQIGARKALGPQQWVDVDLSSERLAKREGQPGLPAVHPDLGRSGHCFPVSLSFTISTLIPSQVGWLHSSIQSSGCPRVTPRWQGNQGNQKLCFLGQSPIFISLLCPVPVIENFKGLLYQGQEQVWGLASNFCSFLLMFGAAWVIKCLVSNALSTTDSGLSMSMRMLGLT